MALPSNDFARAETLLHRLRDLLASQAERSPEDEPLRQLCARLADCATLLKGVPPRGASQASPEPVVAPASALDTAREASRVLATLETRQEELTLDELATLISLPRAELCNLLLVLVRRSAVQATVTERGVVYRAQRQQTP